MKIENVVLPNEDSDLRFNVTISGDVIESKSQSSSNTESPPTILLPALCHPHIHLDKAYLLTSHPKPRNKDYPDYSDLGLKEGDFSEALSKTSQAKTRYTVPDLILRGSQLVAESVRAGVTSMRAFVEIDHVTQFKCLEAAIELKRKFDHLCYVQICAFAQDPIMSQDHGEENRRLMEEALEKFEGHIEVLGTTPYVEKDQTCGVDNVKWAIEKAIEKQLHLDFHLDYNVSPDIPPLIWKVVELLHEAKWTENAREKRIVLGHCTRVTIFQESETRKLVERIADLPIAFASLPTSDLFMMGRPAEEDDQPAQRERGTLQIINMIQQWKLDACIGVNNAGNAFTPWGSADPLCLASLGVGLYHAGTAEHARILYECVSTRARRAIGLQSYEHGKDRSELGDFDLVRADGGGILAISNEENIDCPGIEALVPARQALSVTDVVWDPPETRRRRTIINRGT